MKTKVIVYSRNIIHNSNIILFDNTMRHKLIEWRNDCWIIYFILKLWQEMKTSQFTRSIENVVLNVLVFIRENYFKREKQAILDKKRSRFQKIVGILTNCVVCLVTIKHIKSVAKHPQLLQAV